jgi:uncharacterized Fe-S cluster-containing radical SAM superfamily protein
MSTATDPYQGVESRLKLTRGVLEVFEESGDFGWLVVQTRSPLVERDIDVLSRLGARVMVSVTIETDRDEVRRAITPTSPSIDRRLETLRRLSAEGIETQAAISPCCRAMLRDWRRWSRMRHDEPSWTHLSMVMALEADGARNWEWRRSCQTRDSKGWMEGDAHLKLLEELKSRMGADRVGFSKEGFNLK